MAPKILTIDIETSPNLADVWGLFDQNVSISQLRESTRIICFAAKWHHEDEVIFYSEFHDGFVEMLEAAHQVLSEADIVVHYNGTTFDVKHLNREFWLQGWHEPAPYQQVDLLRTVKAKFRFPSNKLDYIAQTVGLGSKHRHTGHELWVKCMAGDEEAWEVMKTYNIQDVYPLTEGLYDALGSWVKSPPHMGHFIEGGEYLAPCGHSEFHKEGFTLTQAGKFQRYQCDTCGRWFRGSKSVGRTEYRSVS